VKRKWNRLVGILAAIAAVVALSTVATAPAPAFAAPICSDAACQGIPTTKQAVASLLVQMFDTGTPGRLTTNGYPALMTREIRPIAANNVAAICDVDLRSLQTIAIVVKKFGSANLTDLNRHCAEDPEVDCNGSHPSPVHCQIVPTIAVDFDRVGGIAASVTMSQTLLNFVELFAPNVAGGTWAENNCESASHTNMTRFPTDYGCNHQHIDFRGAGSTGLNIPDPNNVPLRAFDTATSPAVAKIRVTGWTYDQDVPSTPLVVEAYLDGDRMVQTYANTSRPDVSSVPHGFDFTFPSNPGVHGVSIYTFDYPSNTRILIGSKSVTVAGTKPTTARVSGVSRYDTAVAQSQVAFPGTAPVVYVANGLDYPDAMTAGPAAAHAGGPLLLTDPTTLSAPTATELARLQPSKVVVVGGTGAVSDAVLAQIQATRPSAAVSRVSGIDRYATARAVIGSSFASGSAPPVFVVDGTDWPDGIIAGNAAVYHNGIVLTINGQATTIDADTKALLASLGSTTVRFVGGPLILNDTLLNAFKAIIPNSFRSQSGADRYLTSNNFAKETYGTASTVYLVSGENFPDGLGASVLTGRTPGPILFTKAPCVYPSTLSTIYALGATKVVAIGGTGVVSDNALNLVICPITG
jgi:putative cell wall-binding protein